MKNNASLARANKNIRRRKLCGKAVTVFLLVALSVVFLVPFAWMLLTSLKSMEEVYQRTIFPTKLHFDNYILAVTQIPFLRYAWNTIVITALCVVGTVISSAMVAYSMSKVRWNGKKYLFPIIVATMMIPYQVTLIPLYMIWNSHQHMVRLYGPYAVSEPSGKLHAFHWPAGFFAAALCAVGHSDGGFCYFYDPDDRPVFLCTKILYRRHHGNGCKGLMPERVLL